VCASVPVHRAKVALLGGVDVSFLIFAASVHYPGRLETRALILSNSSPHARTHSHTQIHSSIGHFCEELALNIHIYSPMVCCTSSCIDISVCCILRNCGCAQSSHATCNKDINGAHTPQIIEQCHLVNEVLFKLCCY